MSLESLLADHEQFHSSLQIDCFIIAKNGGTLYGMYKQALRELDSRYGALGSDHVQRRKLEASLQRLESETVTDEGRFRHETEVMEGRFKLDGLMRTIADREREFARIFAIAQSLKESIGELTPQRREVLEKQLWMHRSLEAAAADLLNQGRVSADVFRMIGSLPSDMRKQCLKMLEQPEGLTTWFCEYEPPAIDIDKAQIPAPQKVRELVAQCR